MRFKMKKTRRYVYGFNIDEELTIYSKIGEKNSLYHNYCEWHNYVFKKYSGDKCTETTLKNFMHYLKREKSVNISGKEIWSSCAIPLITVFITIIYTLVFSVVNIINTYNNSINTLVNDEFMNYTGYDAEMIYGALEQNLYSGMAFYACGAIIMILAVLMFLYIVSFQIKNINLKKEFYSDYIMIIQEIIETQKIKKDEIV